MTENFAQLFEESLKELETRPGAIVKGTIVSIDKDMLFLLNSLRMLKVFLKLRSATL
jgi:ribosomal protein S1